MSTSPSWFDKEKFSRLVKKVGPKSVPGQPGASQPLPEMATSQPLPEIDPNQLLIPEPAPAQPPPEARASQPLPSAASSQPLPERAPSQPLPERAPSQSLPMPSQSGALKRGLMTSQSVSLSKVFATPPSVLPAPREEPIRAPAPTSSISLTSKASHLPEEERTLPALPRRTAPLPALKAIFQYDIPAAQSAAQREPAAQPPIPPPLPSEALSAEAPPVMEEKQPESPVVSSDTKPRRLTDSTALAQLNNDLAAAWEKIAQMNEEQGHINQQLEQALNENTLLHDQLNQANEMIQGQEDAAAQTEELTRVSQERDEALSEVNALREQLQQANDSAQAAQLEELSYVTQERDDIRKEYVNLREQFENLKDEHLHAKGESGENQQELETLRRQLAEREQELKTHQEQARQAKSETAVAQRGLALSQKALQETRDALREAGETGGGVSGGAAKATLDNLKKENATLIQQNMLIQAQHDQVVRDLSAAKAKLSAGK